MNYTNHRFLSSALAVTVLGLFTAATVQADVVFDNISNYQNGVTGASITATSSTPNTFMGDGYTLAPGTTDITGFDLYPVNLSGTTYVCLELNVYVWGTVNTGTVSAGSPAFSNLLGSYSFTSTGSFASGYFYNFESASPGVTPGITLATPLAVTGSSVGITLNIEGSTDGTTYNNINSLTSLISYGTPATVGSDMFNGYYRNANSEVNGDFTSTLRSLGVADQTLAMRIYGDTVPEPTSLALAGMGGLALLGLRRRRA